MSQDGEKVVKFFSHFFFNNFKNSAENGTKPEKLRAVAVKVVNQETCQANYNTQKVKFKVTSQMLCAGWSDGIKDACSGDSVSNREEREQKFNRK